MADTNIFVDIRTLDGDDLGAAAAVVAVGGGGVAVVVVVFAEPIVSGASLIGRNNADENWRQNFGFSSFLNRKEQSSGAQDTNSALLSKSNHYKCGCSQWPSVLCNSLSLQLI